MDLGSPKEEKEQGGKEGISIHTTRRAGGLIVKPPARFFRPRYRNHLPLPSIGTASISFFDEIIWTVYFLTAKGTIPWKMVLGKMRGV